ncbi:MAG TPA: hypothetical protein VMK12_26990 [Anaeromyxobacteraceae bacterium]|nr:hypothetical protein [Anaeromyxobacteraceae bacterium]
MTALNRLGARAVKRLHRVTTDNTPEWLDEVTLAGCRAGAARATLRFPRVRNVAFAEVRAVDRGELRARTECEWRFARLAHAFRCLRPGILP